MEKNRPTSFDDLPLIMTEEPTGLSESIFATLRSNGIPNVSALNLFLGNYAGPMGASAVMILAAAALYLRVRRRLSLRALAGFLAAQGVDTLICGGIGAGARQALAQAGIRLFPGVQGPADEAVKSLLAGTLAYDPDTVCTHHHGEGHEAGHSCAHGGEDGCRHGSCGA